jgi:hypothetical protein
MCDKGLEQTIMDDLGNHHEICIRLHNDAANRAYASVPVRSFSTGIHSPRE